MEQFNPKDYTLIVVNERIELLKSLRLLVFEHSDIIMETESEGSIFYAKDLDMKFYFAMKEPRQERGVVFDIRYTPTSVHSLEPFRAARSSADVIHSFNKWLDLMKQYEQAKYRMGDPIAQKYMDETMAELFTIVDEDAAKEPFEGERRLAIHQYLLYAEQKVLEYGDDPQAVKILEAIREVDAEMPGSNKKKTIRGLSYIIGLAGRYKTSLYNDLFDVAKKELLKNILYQSLDFIQHHILPLLPGMP